MNTTTVHIMQLVGAVIFVLFLVISRVLVKRLGFPSLSDIINAILLGAAAPTAVVLFTLSANPASLTSLPDIHVHLLVSAAAILYVAFDGLIEKSGLVPRRGLAPVLAPLEIEEAVYGYEFSKVDVTDILKGLVQGGRLETTASNSVLGRDPSPGNRKTLKIKYHVDSNTHTRYFPEDEKVILP